MQSFPAVIFEGVLTQYKGKVQTHKCRENEEAEKWRKGEKCMSCLKGGGGSLAQNYLW